MQPHNQYILSFNELPSPSLSCWVQMDKPVFWAQQAPILIAMIITFTLTEAAGAAENTKLEGMGTMIWYIQ